jgi:hypothetical protein
MPRFRLEANTFLGCQKFYRTDQISLRVGDEDIRPDVGNSDLELQRRAGKESALSACGNLRDRTMTCMTGKGNGDDANDFPRLMRVCCKDLITPSWIDLQLGLAFLLVSRAAGPNRNAS